MPTNRRSCANRTKTRTPMGFRPADAEKLTGSHAAALLRLRQRLGLDLGLRVADGLRQHLA
jgi:hypothetical protein